MRRRITRGHVAVLPFDQRRPVGIDENRPKRMIALLKRPSGDGEGPAQKLRVAFRQAHFDLRVPSLPVLSPFAHSRVPKK